MNKLLVVLFVILAQCTLTFCQASQNNFPVLKGPYLGQKPPGIKPEIFAPGIVTTDFYNHCTVCISSDGSEIYWAMSPTDAPRRIYSSKMVNSVWTRPEIIFFTQTEDGDCPVLSPDGKKMFFNSNRPITQGGTRRERIWCVERTPKGWGNPFCLSQEINNEHLHWQISVDSKENIYFGSERAGSKGKDDIFIAELINGKYIKPYSMGTEINSEVHEGCPYIASDGNYLIFGRNGLHISYKQKNGSWTKAKSMGDNYRNAICPYVSPDGKYIFYLGMNMQSTDVFWASAKIIDELRPKE
jgi:hypothetical protein